MSQDKNSQMSFFPEKQSDYEGDFPENSYGNTDDNNIQNDMSSHRIENTVAADSEDSEPENIPLSEILPEQTVTPQSVTSSESAQRQPEVRRKSAEKKLDFNPENSLIISFLILVGGAIAKTLRNSFTATVFTAYNKISADFKESFIYKSLFNQKTDRVTLKIKKVLRRIATNARVPSLIGEIFSSLVKLKARTYGVIFFSFGVMTMLLHFFVVRNFTFFNLDLYAPVTAGLVIILSLFLIISAKTVSDMLKESYFLSTLLFDFLGIKRPSHSENEVVEFPASGAAIVGALFGALTLFFPALSVIFAVITVIYTFIVIKYPETGVVSLILITPILSNSALIYICSVITVSYIFKILVGKRTPNFEFTELIVALFLLLTLMSGIITFGTKSEIFSNGIFIMVYFLLVCTLRDRNWFDRAVKSIILGSCIFASFSLFVTFFGKYFEIDFNYIPNSDVAGAESNIFQSSYVLGIILMCGLLYMLTAFFTAKTLSNKIAFFIFMVIAAIFIFRETSPSIIFALLVSTVIYLFLKSSKTAVFTVVVLCITPVVLSFTPWLVNGIKASLSNEMYRLDIWNAVINMFGKYGLSGIGTGKDAFTDIYTTFYIGNSVNVKHAHSLLFQIAFSLGFFGVVLFALIIFFIMQGALTYGRNCTDKSAENRLLCYSGMCSVIALALCGLTEYIWLNSRIMLVFWILCGLAVCSRRSANERNDEEQLN